MDDHRPTDSRVACGGTIEVIDRFPSRENVVSCKSTIRLRLQPLPYPVGPPAVLATSLYRRFAQAAMGAGGFMEIPKLKPEDGPCFEWQGRTNGKRGYGLISLGRSRKTSRSILAHRLAWEIAYGPIPKGMWVLHKCDNRLCISARHLFLGTAKMNTQDAINKGRYVFVKRLLDEKQVREIRESQLSTRALSRKFKVHRETIGRIKRRTTWTQVE